MQKLFSFFIIGSIIFLNSCNSKSKSDFSSKHAEETQSFFPVTDFFKGQLRVIDSMPVTLLKTVTVSNKTDSAWLKRESIRSFAEPFLTPVIDSTTMSPWFSEKSFMDQTINAVTISYDSKIKLPDSIKLRHWDVYIDPQKGSVERIYIVKENNENSSQVTTQLTWKANQWCSIRTIKQKPGQEPEIKEEKLTWDFNN
ncbi:MAG: hypothetical protein M3Z26_17255 [Bacteroidota bacterium]|nr:hypothetical protein [Bacteroidota bacterium]